MKVFDVKVACDDTMTTENLEYAVISSTGGEVLSVSTITDAELKELLPKCLWTPE